MTDTIHVSASYARQNFFQVLEQVLNDHASFVISRRNFKKQIVIQVLSKKQSKVAHFQDVMKLAGKLKSSLKYQPKETQLAHQKYAENQAKKYL